MASLNDILRNGLPQVLDTVGGLADEVRGIAGTVGDIRDEFRGDRGADTKPEAVAPVNTEIQRVDVQGPDLEKESTNRTLLIAGGVAVGLIALTVLMRR